MNGTIVVTRGARATERALLAEVERFLEQSQASPTLLDRPLRVVVPSVGLRVHVQARLVEARGRAAVGVVVETLWSLACEVLERAGEPPLPGRSPLALLVQRCGRRDAALRPVLDGFEGSSAALLGAVRDLLDAGFTPKHGEACRAALQSLSGEAPAHELERAAAVVRVAAAVHAEAEELGIGLPSTPLGRAAELLEGDPTLLRARAVLVHGFAEATGVATRLLVALLRSYETRVFIDVPRDPASPGDEAGTGFLERLRRRLLDAGAAEELRGDGDERASLRMVAAAGADGEARAVACQARALLDRGVEPERILVVVPRPEEMRAPLARHFDRLGVPFSCRGVPSWAGPVTRQGAALLALLADGEDTAPGVWLAAWGPPEAWRAELDLALKVRGCLRLADVPTALRGAEGAIELPMRERLAEGTGGALVAPRRALAGRVAERAARVAEGTLAALRAWPDEATARRHGETLAGLIAGVLGLGADLPDLRAAIDGTAADLPPHVTLTRTEFRELLAARFTEIGRVEVGGRGGGVQVCSALQARGLTADHLFLTGLNRGVFPRESRADPILADPVRLALRRALPEIPVKRAVNLEERYLFAHFLSAATAAELSWQATDDDGRGRPESPFITRLRLAFPELREGSVSRPGETAAVDEPVWTADECAIQAALAGSRASFRRALAWSFAERGLGSRDAVRLAAARCAALDEHDPRGDTREGRRSLSSLGPFFGFVAPIAGLEPRLSVTLLEGLARCPWRAFLERVLGVEVMPDPAAGLGPGRNEVGGAVHRVLERLVLAAAGNLPTTLAEALEAEPQAVAWPAERALAALVDEQLAGEVAEGRVSGLTAPMLRARVHVLLATARDEDWAEGSRPLAALGVEVKGRVSFADKTGHARVVTFQADRVDEERGRRRVTDYKTGTPQVTATSETGRREATLREVRRGFLLQGAAYAAAGGANVEGRYLYLRPDLEPPVRTLTLAGDDGELFDAFSAAARSLVELVDLGVFVPRLVDKTLEKVGESCESCPVFEACLQHDTVSRHRLQRWVRDGGSAGEGSPELAARALWRSSPEAEEGGAE